MRELDSESGTVDLAAGATALTTPIADSVAAVDLWLVFGDGTNDLSGAAARTITVALAVDGVPATGTDLAIAVQAGRVRFSQAVDTIPVRPGTLTVTLTSSDAGDTSVAVAAYLYDVTALQPTARGRTLAVDAAGRSDVGAFAGVTSFDGQTLPGALRLILSALIGKVSGAGTGPVVIRAADDSKVRITAEGDADGNRTAVTLDGS